MNCTVCDIKGMCFGNLNRHVTQQGLNKVNSHYVVANYCACQ